MADVNEYLVRLALVMDLLPAGQCARGVSASWLTRKLEGRGLVVDKGSLRRNLKEWQEFPGLIRRETSDGTFWKRRSRSQSISQLLRVDDYAVDCPGDLPDWPSDIEM